MREEIRNGVWKYSPRMRGESDGKMTGLGSLALFPAQAGWSGEFR